MIIPDEIKELIHKYIEKNGKRPLGFNYDEWNSFAEYKEYLEKELEKQHLLRSRCFYYGKKVENMYINPFWCGVIATILTELTGIIGYAIYLNIKGKNK